MIYRVLKLAFIMLLLGACTSSIDVLEEYEISAIQGQSPLKSRTLHKNSPMNFGLKIYSYESARWYHDDTTSVYVLPFISEYSAKIYLRETEQVVPCTQVLEKFIDRKKNFHRDYFVTFVPTEGMIDKDLNYRGQELFPISNSSFTGYEIYTNVNTHKIVGMGYYENGRNIVMYNLYCPKSEYEYQFDEMEDLLEDMGIRLSLNDNFDINPSNFDSYFSDYENQIGLNSLGDDFDPDFDCSLLDAYLGKWDCLHLLIGDDEEDHIDMDDGDGGEEGAPIPSAPIASAWNRKSSDTMVGTFWYANLPYQYFEPSAYDALSYASMYFDKRMSPTEFFEKNYQQSTPASVSDDSVNKKEIEKLLSYFFNISSITNIQDSVDKGYICFTLIYDDIKFRFVVALGYRANGDIVYYDPYLGQLMCNSESAFWKVVTYSILGQK